MRSGRLVHEGHELVRETRHRAADTDAADVRATADAGHPSALRNVAVDNRPPATELDQASRRVVVAREITLLIRRSTVAAVVDGVAEQPLRTQLIVERGDRREPGNHVEQVQQRLHEVVGLYRTTGHVDNWEPCL